MPDAGVSGSLPAAPGAGDVVRRTGKTVRAWFRSRKGLGPKGRAGPRRSARRGSGSGALSRADPHPADHRGRAERIPVLPSRGRAVAERAGGVDNRARIGGRGRAEPGTSNRNAPRAAPVGGGAHRDDPDERAVRTGQAAKGMPDRTQSGTRGIGRTTSHHPSVAGARAHRSLGYSGKAIRKRIDLTGMRRSVSKRPPPAASPPGQPTLVAGSPPHKGELRSPRTAPLRPGGPGQGEETTGGPEPARHTS